MVLVAALGYHLYGLTNSLDWSAFGGALLQPERLVFLVVAVLLMPLNWYLEARKWHPLLTAFLPWDFSRTWRTVIAGVSVSAATPNRIGEIGGRMMVAEKSEWPGVIASSLLGSACQWIAFLLLAWPGLIWTTGELLAERIDFSVHWLWPVGPLVLLLGFTVGKGLFLRAARYLVRRWGKQPEHFEAAAAAVNLRLIVLAGSYAALRLSVYCVQLYLLLRFFGLVLPLIKTLAGIAGIYLVQAGLPLPPGANLLTRAEIGLLLWGDAPEIVAATVLAFTTLFIVNVLLPALPGYWLIVQTNKK